MTSVDIHTYALIGKVVYSYDACRKCARAPLPGVAERCNEFLCEEMDGMMGEQVIYCCNFRERP